jgi:hypothetical protein
MDEAVVVQSHLQSAGCERCISPEMAPVSRFVSLRVGQERKQVTVNDIPWRQSHVGVDTHPQSPFLVEAEHSHFGVHQETLDGIGDIKSSHIAISSEDFDLNNQHAPSGTHETNQSASFQAIHSLLWIALDELR